MENLPTIAELTGDLEQAFKQDKLNLLLSQEPRKEWVKEHPYIRNYKYLPIDKVEYLLRRIFKEYRIEITGQGVSFNGVWVTVRLHFLNPINGVWSFHDGIGAMQLQTKKDTSPADLININNGAISMAFPIAKTMAIKDAADMFGKLFGSDLNRKDTIGYQLDNKLNPNETLADLVKLFDSKKTLIPIEEINNIEKIIETKEVRNYKKAITYLSKI